MISIQLVATDELQSSVFAPGQRGNSARKAKPKKFMGQKKARDDVNQPFHLEFIHLYGVCQYGAEALRNLVEICSVSSL